ncbi:hypothetical protein IOC53_02400 [Rathayibacter sp. SD072]|nr:hypothetical protein [Rathayibacter sp. SD072]
MRNDNKAPQAISDGTLVQIECETTGATVTSDAGTSDIWEKTNYGWIPNVFVNTGESGFTTGIPRCDSASAPQPVTDGDTERTRDQLVEAERKNYPDRVNYDPNFDKFLGEAPAGTTYLGPKLYNHFYSKKGGMYYIPWSYFEGQKYFVSWAKKLPKDGYDMYNPNEVFETDLALNLGTFSVHRTSEHCWVVRDLYDFKPHELNLYEDQQSGKARIFASRSSGCIWS